MSEHCTGSCSTCASNCNDKLEKKMALIKNRILVLSGKGGVGKSTVAASLALTLAKKGAKVGLLDLDFHGPSQPTLFSLQTTTAEATQTGLLPVEAAGIKIFSIGMVMEDPDKAIIWRGPAKMGVIKQLLEDLEWGELDYLVFDFPPGTGDEALSACQMLTGPKQAVVVTTPQEVSLADCRKCTDFCHQLEVPVTGIIENMSYFICSDCGHRHTIFQSGGGARLAEQNNTKLIASLPLDPDFLKGCDYGDVQGALERSRTIAEEMGKAADVIMANGI